MKSRNGFISNSSSSSFLIYGVYHVDGKVDWDDIERSIQKLGFKDIELHSPYDDGYYFGVSMEKVGDNETGKAFKDNVQKEVDAILQDLGLPPTKCEMLSESWYNG